MNNNEPIYVTKTYLPPIEEYDRYIKQIWQSGQLTNGGKLVRQLETELTEFMNVPHLQFVANGTLALQLALRTLGDAGGEIITTPFSYVATTSAILWEKFTPVYVDIEPDTFCIDPTKIEAAITKNTQAILAVHVFGNPCDIETIETIAKKHGLKVIYDAAHAFGVRYKGSSLFQAGDISICSFHATKLFHTIEGGAIISKNEATNKQLDLMKRFGHDGDEHFILGINAKASEFHAAMGLANLTHIDEIIVSRRKSFELYRSLLSDRDDLELIKLRPHTDYNYSYFPVLFKNEKKLNEAFQLLATHSIFPRRYFFPSLNTLPYLPATKSCPISESIASRIACLPLYSELKEEEIRRICELLTQ